VAVQPWRDRPARRGERAERDARSENERASPRGREAAGSVPRRWVPLQRRSAIDAGAPFWPPHSDRPVRTLDHLKRRPWRRDQPPVPRSDPFGTVAIRGDRETSRQRILATPAADFQRFSAGRCRADGPAVLVRPAALRYYRRQMPRPRSPPTRIR
jgi:hypothetical protein